MLFFSIAVLIYFGIHKESNSLTIFSIMFLLLEGFLIIALKDCPLTKVHEMFGDDKGFFKLFLPEKHSKLAFKISASIGIFSIAFYMVRII